MIWLIMVIVLLLVLGPFRQGILRAWRFALPAVVGAVVGLALACFWIRFGLPPWMLLFAPVAGALAFGAAGKAWLDENLGPPRN